MISMNVSLFNYIGKNKAKNYQNDWNNLTKRRKCEFIKKGDVDNLSQEVFLRYFCDNLILLIQIHNIIQKILLK